MERCKTQEIKVGEKTVFFYSWKFTEEERERLLTALSNFPGEKVENFINDLEMICICAKQFLNERNITFQRTERKRMLGRFEKAEAELYKLIDKRKDPKMDVLLRDRKNIFEDSIYSSPSFILEKQRLHYLMLAAATQLNEIITLIKEKSGAPGRPSVDAATGDLIKIVAHGFENLFERPTGHKSANTPDGQPFFSVVQVVLEACELPFDDPSRHIRNALKTL